MNSIKIIVSVFAIGLLITSCKQTDSNVSEKKSTLETSSTSKKPISADAKLVTTSFTIEGMTCAIGCAKTIEKELNETNGVKKATVDFDKKLATIEYDSSNQKPENLIKIVEKTGDGETYKVSNLK